MQKNIKLPHDKTLSCFWWSTNKCCLTGSTRVYCVCSSHLGLVCKFCLVLHSRKRQSAECICVLQSNRYTHREITAGMHTSFSISALHFADTFFCFQCFSILCLFFLFSLYFFSPRVWLTAKSPRTINDTWSFLAAMWSPKHIFSFTACIQTHTNTHPYISCTYWGV